MSLVAALLDDEAGFNHHERIPHAPRRHDDGRGGRRAERRSAGPVAGIGAQAIPGLGPFIAAGPIMGALAGLGVGGAVDGLVGALVGMGIRNSKRSGMKATSRTEASFCPSIATRPTRLHGRRMC